MGRSWRITLFASACAMLLACGDDDASLADGGVADAGDAGEGEPTPEVHAEVTPFPFTSVLSDEAGALLDELSDDGMTLTFAGESDELDALEADRIVVVPSGPLAPYGLLRRIDAVERDGERVVLTTRESSVLFAFEKVDITVHAGGPSQASSVPRWSTALSIDSSGAYPFTHDVDWVVFDGDKNDSTIEDRVLVSGELQASVGYDFHLAFNWGELQDIIDCIEGDGLSCIESLNPLNIASGIGLDLRFVADLGAGADLNVSGASALSFEKEIPLGPPVPLPKIFAGPILLTPRLVATAGVEGSAVGRVDIDVAVSGGVEFGLEASGASVWPVGQGPYLDMPSGDATIQVTARAKAWVNPRVELLIYEAVGPTIGLAPYAEVRADSDEDPCWHLEGGLDATIGIHLGAGPVTLISESASLPIESQEFASGDCPLPDGPGGGSLDPTFEPWASAASGPLYSSGAQGDSTALAPTHDGKYLFTASTAKGLLKVDDEGTPLWSRTYVRDELETLYAERAVSLADASILIMASNGAVLRTDELGNLLDAHTLDVAHDGNTHVGASARTEQGGAWIAGDSPTDDGTADGWLARFAPDGSLLDAFAIRGPIDERPKTIVLLDDGGALIAGEGFDAGKTRGWAARVNADGEAQWFVRLVDCELEAGLDEDDIAVESAVLTDDGNFVLAGYTFYPDYRGMMVKLNASDGSLAWGQTYAAELLGLQLEAVTSLESGGFLVGGTLVDIGPNDAIGLAETDSAGNIAWLQRYDGPGRDGHVSLFRTPADNGVLLAATAEGLTGDEDAALILKVPRKSGEIAFEGDTGTAVSELATSDAGVCLDVEPYADGLIEPIAATLIPLPAVVDAALELGVVVP